MRGWGQLPSAGGLSDPAPRVPHAAGVGRGLQGEALEVGTVVSAPSQPSK